MYSYLSHPEESRASVRIFQGLSTMWSGRITYFLAKNSYQPLLSLTVVTSRFHVQVMTELDAAVKRLDQSEGGKTSLVQQVCIRCLREVETKRFVCDKKDQKFC